MDDLKKTNQDFDLSGKTSVITGGTSGIGEAIASSFCLYGCRTIIIGRDAKKGSQAAKRINEKCEKEMCTFYKCDVGILAEARETCTKVLSEYPKIDILVLNAATEYSEPINEIKIENWKRVFDVNVNGAFYFVRFLIGPMISNKKGNIIVIGSVVSHTGAGGGMHYSSSKSALIGIMNRVNYELLTSGIRSNMISPGVIDTAMLRKKYPDKADVNKKIVDQIPVGRIGIPQDVANAALFLASDMSEYIVGQDILIDGGRLYYRRPAGK